MMDKEAQEMIANIICQSDKYPNPPIRDGDGNISEEYGAWVSANQILLVLPQLGYHKLKDKPPLLTEEEIGKLEEKERVEQGGYYLEWMPPKIIAQAQLDKAWDMAQQDAIYWRGWLEQVMSEHLAEGISEKTKEKVLEALKKNGGE